VCTNEARLRTVDPSERHKSDIPLQALIITETEFVMDEPVSCICANSLEIYLTYIYLGTIWNHLGSYVVFGKWIGHVIFSRGIG